jgi:molybdenum cofactor synthesis domain-containing protein
MDTVAVLIVGDEILSGEIADENGPFLLKTLSGAGIRVTRLVTVPDRETDIVSELRRAREAADAVVVSGGIGPTHDDVTRPAVARAIGASLVSHPEAEALIRGFYRDRVTEAELRMALMPAGARLVCGVATGSFGFGVSAVYVLPGVPFLFRDLARGLVAEFRARPLHRAEVVTRRREGEIAPCLAALQARAQDVAIGSYPVYEAGDWHVRVVVRAADPGRLEEAVAQVRRDLDGLDRAHGGPDRAAP